MPATSDNPVLACARAYLAAGISIIPIRTDGSKAPDSAFLPRIPDPQQPDKFKPSWKPYQERLATDDELVRWFGGAKPAGIAAVGGAISQGLQCIDLDNQEIAKQYHQTLLTVQQGIPPLTEVHTPNGVHLWYRCEEIEGNQKLAWPPQATKPFKALIETRAEGGYALLPGSPLGCHESGRPYLFFGEADPLEYLRDWSGPPVITPGQRQFLLTLARSFDRTPPPPPKAATPFVVPPVASGKSIPDQFDSMSGWEEIFGESGASLCSGTWELGRLTRPGKDKGVSGTIGVCHGSKGESLFYCFSSSWPPFESGKSYGRYNALRLLKFGGDNRKTFQHLRSLGYRQEKPPAPAAVPRVAPPNAEAATPAPAESGQSDWHQPIPLTDQQEAPPEFPRGVFPEGLDSLLAEIAQATQTPLDYPAVYALGILAGSIGGRWDAQIKPGYRERSSLYLCLVAPSGSGKTPAGKVLMGPVYAEQSRRAAEKKRQPAYIGNITVEAITSAMSNDPRGQMLYRDELRSWVMSMNQYKARGGADRQFFLDMWSSEQESIHRKDTETPEQILRHPRLTIFGGIQPTVLRSLRKAESEGDSGDGFWERVLFSWPLESPMAPENWQSIAPDRVQPWERCLRRIWDTPLLDGDHGHYPRALPLDEEAQYQWEQWTRWISDHANADGGRREVASKIRGYAARLSLCLAVLWGHWSDSRMDTHIRGHDMLRGISLARYFLGHAQRIQRHASCSSTVEQAEHILGNLRGWKVQRFRRSELWQRLRGSRNFDGPDSLWQPLRLLCECHWLKRVEDTPPERGRPPSPEYDINPLWERSR